MFNKLKEIYGIIAILLVSLFIGLAITEIGLRVLGISNPAFWMNDSLVGHSLVPGAKGWFTGEGKAYVQINQYGLRDREHSQEKPAGTFRIAVLGDSFTEALQVPRENTFWSVMEKKLGGCAAYNGLTVEAVNFGISGQGTAQQLLTLRHRVWNFDPDLVLLAFYTGNDVRNNSRALEKSPNRPYFVLRKNALVLDDSFKKLPDFSPEQLKRNRNRIKWINRSYLIQLLRASKNALAGFTANKRKPHIGEVGINNEVFAVPRSNDWRQAWRVTEALLLQMKSEIEERGKTFGIVTLTSGIQVHPDKELRKRYAESIETADLSYPDRRIATLGNQSDIQVITLFDPLREYVDATGVFLHGFDDSGTGHWNRVGHSLAGKIIAERICNTTK